MKKRQTKLETQIDWLKNEIRKDYLEIDLEKKEFINSIKKLKKDDILPKKPKKLSIWQKMKKILMIS